MSRTPRGGITGWVMAICAVAPLLLRVANAECGLPEEGLASDFQESTGGRIPEREVVFVKFAMTSNNQEREAQINAITEVLNQSPGRLEFVRQMRDGGAVEGLSEPRIFLGKVTKQENTVNIAVYMAEGSDDVTSEDAESTEAALQDVDNLNGRIRAAVSSTLERCAEDVSRQGLQSTIGLGVVTVTRPRSTFTLLALMLVPTWLIFVGYMVNSTKEVQAKWRVNKDYRKQQQQKNAKDLSRIRFDKGGKVVAEVAYQHAKLEQLERIVDLLEPLVRFAFANMTVYKHNAALRSALEAARRCTPAVRNLSSSQGKSFLTIQMHSGLLRYFTTSFEAMETAVSSLTNRVPYSGDLNKVLESFKKDLAILHSAFGDTSSVLADSKGAIVQGYGSEPKDMAAMTKKVETLKKDLADHGAATKSSPLEPKEDILGVRTRNSYWVSRMNKILDKYRLGSKSLLVAVLVVFLAAGPVRFNGILPLVLLLLICAISLWLMLCSFFEHCSSIGRHLSCGGIWQAVRLNFVRALLGLAGVILGAFLMISYISELGGLAKANEQLEFKPTFLEVPPQYKLEEVSGQAIYVSTIFGIMHGNLMVLCLLPLPICYYTQTFLVRLCPRLRHCIPMSPVWLHRTLGYVLLGGLSFTGFLWIIFQGNSCFRGDVSIVQTSEGTHVPRACDAFDPDAQAGKDVFMLRFEIVWPLIFFFIPLMIYMKDDSMYPGHTGKKRAAPAQKEGEKKGDKDMEVGKAGPQEKKSDSVDEGGARRCSPEVRRGWLFSMRRLTDISLLIISVAGCSLIANKKDPNEVTVDISLDIDLVKFDFGKSLVPYGFMPWWFIIASFLVLKALVQVSSFVWEKYYGGVGEIGEAWDRFFERIWWEMAYWCHSVAFVTMVAAALLIRFQVFYGALLPWGIYIFDRVYGVVCSIMNKATIVLSDSGKTSYCVEAGTRPSHVRLVLKKPKWFKYEAGQWCQLAFLPCGSYPGPASCFPPLLQWHPFSIASAPGCLEDEDLLEFHIAVSDTRFLEGSKGDVRVVETRSGLKIQRDGSLIDRICPHRVPRGWGTLGATDTYEAEAQGIYLNLTPQKRRTGSWLAKLRGLFGKAEETKAQQPLFGRLRNYFSPTKKSEPSSSITVLKPQEQWTGKLWNLVRSMERKSTVDQCIHLMGPYGSLPACCFSKPAVMLIGAGVGYPSTGAMLRQILAENRFKSPNDRRSVCFMWSASKVDQLLLCFPSLLADLTRYVHDKSLKELQEWLTIKIFVGRFEASDFLKVDPGPQMFGDKFEDYAPALKQVRGWLLGLGKDGGSSGAPEDGTYIARGSLGASFGDILRKSTFVQKHVIEGERPLGVCCCGPLDLCNWLRTEVSNTILPSAPIEFASECAGA